MEWILSKGIYHYVFTKITVNEMENTLSKTHSAVREQKIGRTESVVWTGTEVGI